MARALAANPQHAGAQALSSRVAAALEERAAAEAARRQGETIDELVAAAATHLQDADVQGDHATLAVQKIEAALALDPSHAEALALKAAAEDAVVAQRRARAAIRNARNRVSLGKHRAAIQLLENLEAELQPLVADVLNELRHALSEIEERQRREKEAVGDATVFIPPPAARSSNPSPDRLTPQEDDDGSSLETVEDSGRLWRWGVVAVAAVVFLVILIVLYRIRVP